MTFVLVDLQWDPGSRRLRCQRNRGEDPGHQLGQESEETFPRYTTASLFSPLCRAETTSRIRLRLSASTGVCLGMQLAVCEFARNVIGWDGKDD